MMKQSTICCASNILQYESNIIGYNCEKYVITESGHEIWSGKIKDCYYHNGNQQMPRFTIEWSGKPTETHVNINKLCTDGSLRVFDTKPVNVSNIRNHIQMLFWSPKIRELLVLDELDAKKVGCMIYFCINSEI